MTIVWPTSGLRYGSQVEALPAPAARCEFVPDCMAVCCVAVRSVVHPPTALARLTSESRRSLQSVGAITQARIARSPAPVAGVRLMHKVGAFAARDDPAGAPSGGRE